MLVVADDVSDAIATKSRLIQTERLAAIGKMAAGVAHELRNGLATLRGYLTLVERRPEDGTLADEVIDAGAVGFGEMASLHISAADGHPYEFVPADHPLLGDLRSERVRGQETLAQRVPA